MTKPHRPWWKKLLLFSAFAIIAILTLVALAVSWISLKGRSEWAKTKADLVARGEKLSLVEFLPPPIPDEKNFFGDPMWKELLDTVEYKSPGNPLPQYRVRLDRGKRQIDALTPPAPPELVARAKQLGFTLSSDPSFPETTLSIALKVPTELRKVTDPAARRDLSLLVLDATAPGLPTWRHIESLLDRPGAVYPTDYSRGMFTPIEHISYLITIAKYGEVRATAHLALGDAKAAGDNIITILRLADTLNADPLLISLLVRKSILGVGTSLIDRGIAAHQWNDQQLLVFERYLSRADFPRQMAFVLRSERGMANQMMQMMSGGGATGSEALAEALGSDNNGRQISSLIPMPAYRFALAGDQASYNRIIQQYIDALDTREGISPARIPEIEKKSIIYDITHVLTALTAPPIRKSIAPMIYFHNAVQGTRIACALERYRLRHREYPGSLDALAPEFIAAIPRDAVAGQEFHYRRENVGKFHLWSAGWNQKDDGGVSAKSRGAFETDDWVWSVYPGSKPPR